MAKPKTFPCPVCNRPIHGGHDFGAIQHHLWGGHGVENPKAHVIAEKILSGRITPEELTEIKGGV